MLVSGSRVLEHWLSHIKTATRGVRFIGSKKDTIMLLIKITNLHTSQFFIFFYKNGPTPASFSFIFGLFKQTLQFLQQ